MLLHQYFKTFLLGGCLLALQPRCSPKQAQISTQDSLQLVFGRGGGITGEETGYVLLGNGHLLEVSRLLQDTTELATIDASTTQRMFDALETLDMAQLDFQHPGNLYYFIRQKQVGTTMQVVWGDPSYTPPAAVKQFYDTLKNLIPKN